MHLERAYLVNGILARLIIYINEEKCNKLLIYQISNQATLIDEEAQTYRRGCIINLFKKETDSKKHVLKLEYKRNISDSLTGLTQLCFEIKDIFKKNNDLKPVFGVLTDGLEYLLVKYDGNIFIMSEKLCGVFKGKIIKVIK